LLACYPTSGCVDFKFIDGVPIGTSPGAIDPNIPSTAGGEGNVVHTAVAGRIDLDPGPITVVGGNLNLISRGVVGVPIDNHPVDRACLTKIDLQPLGSRISGPPAGRGIAIHRLAGGIGTAVRAGGAGGFIQRQIGRGRRRPRAETADIGGLGQLINGQGNPVQSQVIPPFEVVAIDLGPVVAMTGGTDRQPGGGGTVGEVRHRVGLTGMFDLGHTEVNGITGTSFSILAGKLRDKQIKDSTAGTPATTAETASLIAPRSTIGGFGVKRRGVVAGRAGPIVLDRSAFVVHVAAMALTTSGLRRTVGGRGGDFVAMGAIAGPRPGGGVVRAGLVAVGADARIVGRGVADRAVAIDTSQRIAMVDLRNRRRVAGLTGATVQGDGAVAVSTFARGELGLRVVIRRQGRVRAMAGGADDAADFGADMANGAIAKLEDLGGMVSCRRPDSRHGPIMATGAIQAFDVHPGMTGGALTHLIGDGHVVLVHD